MKDGKIQSLRAYAGWRAVMALTGGPVAAADASSKTATPERIAAANKELLRRFYKGVYVDWNMALVDEVVSPEFMSHDWREGGPKGPQAFRDYYSGL